MANGNEGATPNHNPTKRGRQDSNGSKNDMKSPNGKTAKYESKKEEEREKREEEEERKKKEEEKKREEEIKKIEEERKEEEKREEERNKNKIKVFEKMGILATENYGNKEKDEDNYDDTMTEFCIAISGLLTHIQKGETRDLIECYHPALTDRPELTQNTMMKCSKEFEDEKLIYYRAISYVRNRTPDKREVEMVGKMNIEGLSEKLIK